MKLPIQFPFGKKNDKQYYLSLLLCDEKAHATIFCEKQEKIEVIGEKEEHFHTPLEHLSDEALLDILDKTITSAESSLPEGYQTQKTIFGVKENWIEEGKIKKEYLGKLKKICDALGLTPIGFLVNHEAIAHLLQKLEGAPVSAILVELGTHELGLSILRGGKLLETKRVALSESVAQTIDKTLLHFTQYEILPSRIILFNGTHHEKISQELISHQWSKTIPFLHVPQIKMLPNSFASRSVLFGAATQMGFEVLDKFDMPTLPDDISIEKQPAHAFLGEEKIAHEEKAPEDTFGFVSEKDVADDASPIASEHPTETNIHADSFEEVTPEKEDAVIDNYNQEFFDSEHEETETTHHKKSPFLVKATHFYHTASHKTKSFFKTLPLPGFLSQFPLLRKNKALIFVPPILIGVLLLLFLGYTFLLKATVVIQIDPKTIEKTQDITFSTKQATDPTSNIIAAETVSVTEQGSAQTSATGKKEIGEKAKGTVTILSSLPKSQNISAGTTITSANGLAFTLDKDISLASSSGVSDIKSASSGVSAKEIGKEYNLPSGTTFSVTGFDKSSIQGKNDNAFSGGSKTEITVVSKADIAKITDTVPKQLEAKAKGDLEGKLDSGKALLPILLGTTIDKKTFDKDVGDEATSVSVEATVSYAGAAYTKKEVDLYAFTVLSNENGELAPSKESVSYTISDISGKSGDITAQIAIKGYLLPKIEKVDVAEKIAGKSFEEALQILKQMPQVKSAQMNLHPGLPFFPSLLPRVPQNITIEVATNG